MEYAGRVEKAKFSFKTHYEEKNKEDSIGFCYDLVFSGETVSYALETFTKLENLAKDLVGKYIKVNYDAKFGFGRFELIEEEEVANYLQLKNRMKAPDTLHEELQKRLAACNKELVESKILNNLQAEGIDQLRTERQGLHAEKTFLEDLSPKQLQSLISEYGQLSSLKEMLCAHARTVS